jgi:deoxyribodipyrimidine photo-lyase
VLSSLLGETGATTIFAAEDFSPYARKRDALVASRLPLTLVNGLTVHHPSAVRKADGNLSAMFTPFSRAWKRLPVPGEHDLLPALARLNPPPDIPSQALPLPPLPAYFLLGEARAREALRLFTQSPNAPVYSYTDGRNRLDGDGTSALSPYLRFGMISAREVAVGAHPAIESPATLKRARAQKCGSTS